MTGLKNCSSANRSEKKKNTVFKMDEHQSIFRLSTKTWKIYKFIVHRFIVHKVLTLTANKKLS